MGGFGSFALPVTIFYRDHGLSSGSAGTVRIPVLR